MTNQSGVVDDAAERLRTYYATELRCSPILVLADCEEVAKAYLAETDPAPISTQALRADGWEFINNREWKNGDSFVGQVAFIWFFRCLSNRVQINSLETMGQLRTAVRLSQPPSSSTKGEGE